eukprot:SM000180S03500  [mRNA]  locus=s180:117359:122046:+ [translate_table: standard]
MCSATSLAASRTAAAAALAGRRRASLLCAGSFCGPAPSSSAWLGSKLGIRLGPEGLASRRVATISAALNANKEYVIVGGGNAAGYAAKAFVEQGHAEGKLCIVTADKVAPYERPTLTKGYLFPLDAKPPRLPGFHTSVGGGGERQTPEWYQQKGIEVLYSTTITGLDTGSRTLKTSSGDEVAYKNLVIATGSTAIRLPEKIGGHLPGVHVIRSVEDADGLVEAFQNAKAAVIVGGGYIGEEVGAACATWKIPTTIVFPEGHLMPRLFTPSVAANYEKLYESKGVKFRKGTSVAKIIPGADGKVSKVELESGEVLEADLVIVGVGARPVVEPFLNAGLKSEQKGIEVNGMLCSSDPNIYAIGDVAAFPLKLYERRARVEHVDHARRSGAHVVNSIVKGSEEEYDYLPYFYSRVFEHPGSERKIWWQFYGDNVGESVEKGNFDPKLLNIWVKDGHLKGILLESGTPEEFALLPKLARAQPKVDISALGAAKSVEDALKIAQSAMEATSNTSAA